ncbi:MAG: carboxypeptidase-like regulatory domain-containing protein [Bacteroidales bacterium]|nr:carboxypeptidase-like regulatory domain-containing protein [Bacteroidales bacterium]
MRRVRHICLHALLLLLPALASAQVTRVHGKVTDAATGSAIPYVPVYFSGTYIGTTTNDAGEYALEAAEQEVRSITAEVGGYVPRTLPVAGGKEQVIDFQLVPDGTVDPATLLQDSRYVRSILYNLNRNKFRHDPESVPAWEARLYSKVELAVANVENFVGRALFRKRNDLIPEMRDTTFTGYIPVLFSEAVLRRYFAVEPAVDREVFEASRISGLDQQNVLRQFTGSSTLRMNFYRDIIPVFNLSVPSPASAVGHLFYHYTLVDSLTVGGRKTYSISFVPKKMITSPTMEGRMEVDAEDYAISSVHARLSPSANINWIRQLNVDSESIRRDDGTWFFDRENLFLDASVHLNDRVTVVSLQMKRDIDYTDVVFGPFAGMEELAGGDKVGVDEHPDKDAAWWEEARPKPLSVREQSIFTTAERFKETSLFKWGSALGNMFATGYLESMELGIGYGPWEKTVTFNGTEGVRLQAGGHTTKEFSRKVRLSGYAGYGFRDREWKWGAFTEFMLGDNQKRTNKLSVSFSKDYESLGRGSGVFTERNIVNSLLAPGGFDKQGLVFGAQVEHRYEFSPNFNSILSLQHLRIYANPDIPLIRPDGTPAGSFSTNQIHWTGRFSWNERVNRGVFDKSYIFTRYPIVSVDLLGGVKGITSDDCSFLRGELTVDWRIPAGILGFGRFHLNGGAILGSVPYPLLKLHEGNQSQLFGNPTISLLDKSAFSLMNFYEFGSDRWVTSFYEHNFNGLLFGILPLIKHLDLREVVTVRGAWGTITEQNRSQAPFLLMEGLQSLEKPYVEAGVGIANIFHLLRVDCFWKLTHRNGRDFAVNIGLDIDF